MTQADVEQARALALSAVKEAGQLLRQRARQPADVLSADGRNIKLAVDQETEALLVERLQASSEHPILAEEGGERGRTGQGRYWVVDPLDGSANFVRGIPLHGVAVALMDGPEPVMGVTYDFGRDEMFSGIPGVGAWLGTADQPDRDRLTPGAVHTVDQAYLATGFPVERSFETAALERMIGDFQRFKKIRMFGSAALSLAYVAAGRVNAYAEDDIMLWDVAAGVALVRGAGGAVRMTPSPRVEWAVRIRAGSSDDLLLHWNPEIPQD